MGITWKLGLQVKCGVASVEEVWGSHSCSASLRRGGLGRAGVHEEDDSGREGEGRPREFC